MFADGGTPGTATLATTGTSEAALSSVISREAPFSFLDRIGLYMDFERTISTNELNAVCKGIAEVFPELGLTWNTVT